MEIYSIFTNFLFGKRKAEKRKPTQKADSQIYKPTKLCIQSLQKHNGWKIKLHDLVDGLKFYKKLNDIDDTYSKFTYCM